MIHPTGRAERLKLKKQKDTVAKKDRQGHVQKKLTVEREIIHDFKPEVSQD